MSSLPLWIGNYSRRSNAGSTSSEPIIRSHVRSSDALLMGRIFDDRGNRMTPSYARKGGKRYRYCLTSALTNDQAEHAGAIRRVPASEVEDHRH